MRRIINSKETIIDANMTISIKLYFLLINSIILMRSTKFKSFVETYHPLRKKCSATGSHQFFLHQLELLLTQVSMDEK